MDQQMQERMQALEDALIRCRWGRPDEEDWCLIWHECGLSDRYKKFFGENYVTYSARQRRI